MKAVSLDTLPLGFRFRPTDEELIHHYLRLKINSRHSEVHVIPEVDVCKWEPWDLPRLSMIKTEDPEWFFFCPRDRKYPNGQRSNRATDAGYWKATGKDRTIKSCKFKSASNTSGLIGMKKTLVFYRGRAPKGERTNWIMHEYRPTLMDLDGTGPGQSAYVLFRLFHKTEEKSDSLKCDEVEQSDLSPSTNKSCSDDTPSNFLQGTATSDLQGGDQMDSIKGSLNEKTDNMTPIARVPGESCSSSYIASEVEDRVTGETPVKEHMLPDGNSKFHGPCCGQIETDFISSSQSQLGVDAVPCVDSPFASDFGTDNNGLNFLDGTSEQDASLTYLLDEFYNNHEEFSREESTSHKNSANDSNTHSSGQLGMSHNIPTGNSYLNGVDMYTEISKIHGPFESSRAKVPCYEQLKLGDIRGFGGNINGHNVCNDSSAGGSGNPMLDEYEKSATWNYPVESFGNQFGGTGIKIRTRQPQYQISDNYTDQGTASRRILLQRSKLPGSMSNTRGTNQSKEQDEVESACTEARDAAEQSPVYGESETKCAILDDKIELISRRTALNCVNINSKKVRACHPQHQPCKNEILTEGFTPGSICLQTNNPTSSISSDSARELSPSIKNSVQLVANTFLSEFHSHSMPANSEKEDEVDSVSTKAKEVTELGPIFDKLYEENHLLDFDTSKETVEDESFTGQVDQNREFYDTSSAELIDSSRVSLEESSAKLRFRAKQGNVLVSHQKQSLLSLQSSHLHHGRLSLLFRLGICVILVMFIILLGIWRSSDPSAAWEIL